MSDSDDDFRSSDKTKTRRYAVRTHNIPNGHCLLHQKWKNQNVAQSISKILTVKFVGDLPHADFQPSAKTFVVYLDVPDIVNGVESLKTKFDKISEYGKCKEDFHWVFIFLKTDFTSQYFGTFQREIVINRGYIILPISEVDQVGQILQQLQVADNKRNPFEFSPKKTKSPSIHKDILLAVCQIPGLGEKKSRQLLNKMDSIRKISRAGESELRPILGPNVAAGVEDFFKRNSHFFA